MYFTVDIKNIRQNSSQELNLPEIIVWVFPKLCCIASA